MIQQDLFQRFLATVSAMLKGRQNSAIATALETVLKKAQNGEVIVKYELQRVEYGLKAPLVSLDVLMCPKCGRLFRADRGIKWCPYCGVELQQAYVGVPYVETSYHQYITYTEKKVKLIAPITEIKETYCRRHKDLKALTSRSDMRPLQSLTFACPFNDSSCQYYNQGLCTEGPDRIYFPPYQGMSRLAVRPVLAKPSVGITKPFTVTVFPSDPKPGTGKALGGVLTQHLPVAKEVMVGKFTVSMLTLMYLLGHPYSSRYRRLPVFDVDNRGKLIIIGRKLETDGLLIKLDYQLVEKIGDEVKADPLTVAHTISHTVLLALTRLTGLSPSEFGEAIFVDAKGGVAEILVYDNSPGGIGGVRTVANDVADFIEYVCDFSRPCPRMCRSACRACVFYETCAFGNMFLSWRAAEKAVNISACLQP
jgi:uncharacterized Zn finger protein (UPF0148 family)